MQKMALVLAGLLIVGCTERRAEPPSPQVGAAAQPAPAQAPAASTALTCDWPGFVSTMSVDRLTELFGASNVKALDSEEGITPVNLFADDPKRAMQVQIFSGGQFQGASVDSPASTWTIPGGVGMGASLEDVARANGGPFELHVYADGAGIKDWKGGALGSGGCSFFVTFKHNDPKLAGDSTRLSDDPAIQASGLKVFRFGVN